LVLIFSRTATSNAVSIVPPPVFLFVRQENEEIFTPLCLAQPTLDGMILAVSAKYQVSINYKLMLIKLIKLCMLIAF
jgi:hypothetical protein